MFACCNNESGYVTDLHGWSSMAQLQVTALAQKRRRKRIESMPRSPSSRTSWWRRENVRMAALVARWIGPEIDSNWNTDVLNLAYLLAILLLQGRRSWYTTCPYLSYQDTVKEKETQMTRSHTENVGLKVTGCRLCLHVLSVSPNTWWFHLGDTHATGNSMCSKQDVTMSPEGSDAGWRDEDSSDDDRDVEKCR